MKKCIKYIIFCVVLLIGRGEVWADGSEVMGGGDSIEVKQDALWQLRSPGEKFIQKYREDPVFDYSVSVTEKVNWWERVKWWILEHIFRDRYHQNMEWLDILLKVFAGCIVVFAIYKLIRSKYLFPVAVKPSLSEGVEAWVGEAWEEQDYQQMVEQAVGKKDFVLAIRIHYWYMLHAMDEQGLIHWDRYKTNMSYCYELEDRQMRDSFEKLTYIFDCVCYGEFEVDASLYEQVEPEFKACWNNLKK